MPPKRGRGQSRGSITLSGPAQAAPARSQSQSRTPAASRGSTPHNQTPQAFRTPDGSGDEGSTSSRSYPVVVSPVKQRQRAKNVSTKRMSDSEVWEMDDDEIIGESVCKFLCIITR